MTTTTKQIDYFVQTCAILQKYSLATLIEDMPLLSINDLIIKHQDDLRTIDTYEKALIKGNEVMAKLSGMNLNIKSFITKDSDLRALYSIAINWRESVLNQKKMIYSQVG